MTYLKLKHIIDEIKNLDSRSNAILTLFRDNIFDDDELLLKLVDNSITRFNERYNEIVNEDIE